jgi:hypothetical protein
MVSEMLGVLRRTQDSLRLLQQWRPASAGETGPGTDMTDVEKIYRQLTLGVPSHR